MTNKLPTEHIVVGNYIWYGGETSMMGWNCPAKIIKVEDGHFWVMSLDDMKEQSQSYRITMCEHEPESRKSMRATSKDDAHEYMRKVLANARKRLIDIEEEFDRKTRKTNAIIETVEKELTR